MVPTQAPLVNGLHALSPASGRRERSGACERTARRVVGPSMGLRSGAVDSKLGNGVALAGRGSLRQKDDDPAWTDAMPASTSMVMMLPPMSWTLSLFEARDSARIAAGGR